MKLSNAQQLALKYASAATVHQECFAEGRRKLQSISCWALITYLTFYCLRNGPVFAPGFILSPDLCRTSRNYRITKVFIEPTNLRIALYSLIPREYFFKCFLLSELICASPCETYFAGNTFSGSSSDAPFYYLDPPHV